MQSTRIRGRVIEVSASLSLVAHFDTEDYVRRQLGQFVSLYKGLCGSLVLLLQREGGCGGMGRWAWS